MKTKIILSVLLALCLFSCSKDDDTNNEPQIPENEKLIDEIISSDSNFSLTYNADKTVESLNLSNQLLFLFSYSENQISTMEFVGNGQSQLYTFEYDDNGRISSFTSDDEVTPVVWNEANHYYFYQKGNADEVGIFLNEYDDIKKLTLYDDSEDETESSTFFYEESKKGPMTNTNQVLTHIVVAFNADALNNVLFFLSLFSKKPIEMLAFPFGILTYENTYDGQGFVSTSSVIYGNDTLSFSYNYTQLTN